MNFSSFLIEQILKRLDLPQSASKQLRIASSLADIDGEGFPKELFQLSAPVIIRGLLNFALLQTRRGWVFPYWVERQLDPNSPSYVARSQNPLLINVTHRNWTSLGTLHGYHEAIVDPCGLATPLPREWSVDVWLASKGNVLFPSRTKDIFQSLNPSVPLLTTSYRLEGVELRVENFVGETRQNVDILFNRATITNGNTHPQRALLCIAVRPFNPEGISSIESIQLLHSRIVSVNRATGVVLSKKPDAVVSGSALDGDAAWLFQKAAQCEGTTSVFSVPEESGEVRCKSGLATLGAVYAFDLQPTEQKEISWSIALGTETYLRRSSIKPSWRVSFDRRCREYIEGWRQETDRGMELEIFNPHLKNLFRACRNTLLMFHDGSFVSPGPYLYHHFWFRDAAPMLRALDVLGFPDRVRQVVNTFQDYLTPEGFYRAPGGEWDSNGCVLWSVYQHYRMTRSFLWLRHLYPSLMRAARWIEHKRSTRRDIHSSHRGLMPPSLSAEHLGTVDQYYWDSLWSLAGIRSIAEVARELNIEDQAGEYDRLYRHFETDILRSMSMVREQNGNNYIPSSPSRPFDETAVGTISAIYPLMVFSREHLFLSETLDALTERFVDVRGFFHPFIHSGYNAYLTMQIAHSYLWLGNKEKAWEIASTIFKQATDPYSIPEAIHPRAHGGSMGDGHHGWAAAEIVLFLRDSHISEEADVLKIFSGLPQGSIPSMTALSIKNAHTSFGTISCAVRNEGSSRYALIISSGYHPMCSPRTIEVTLPIPVKKLFPTLPDHVQGIEMRGSSTVLRISPDVRTLIFECHETADGAS